MTTGLEGVRIGAYRLDMLPVISSSGSGAGQGGVTTTLLQANIVGFAGSYTFYPVVAADATGDMALPMATTSATLAPSLLYAAHHAGDVRGELGGMVLLAHGGQPASQHWGDYLGAALAPSGDSTASPEVWVAGAVNDSAPGGWHTTIWQLGIGGD